MKFLTAKLHSRYVNDSVLEIWKDRSGNRKFWKDRSLTFYLRLRKPDDRGHLRQTEGHFKDIFNPVTSTILDT